MESNMKKNKKMNGYKHSLKQEHWKKSKKSDKNDKKIIKNNKNLNVHSWISYRIQYNIIEYNTI